MFVPDRAEPAKLEAWLNLSQREKAREFVIVRARAIAVMIAQVESRFRLAAGQPQSIQIAQRFFFKKKKKKEHSREQHDTRSANGKSRPMEKWKQATYQLGATK